MTKRKETTTPSAKRLAPLLILLGLIAAGCVLSQNLTSTGPAPSVTTIEQPTKPVSAQQNDLKADPDTAFIYGGLPKATDPSAEYKVIRNRGYLVGYSESRKDPLWTAYRLYRLDNAPTYPRPSKFNVDARTEAKVRPEDYSSTGYDRGHMAPNSAIATHYGPEAQVETFFMSNICPQKPKLNRQVWERLEQTEAKDYANRFEEIWVVDGPIFGEQPSTIKDGVEIPNAFYKIIVDEVNGKPHMLGFVIPQTVKGDEPAGAFLTDVKTIESEVHLDFFWELDHETEEQVESEKPTAMW